MITTSLIGWVLVEGGSIFVSLVPFSCFVVIVVCLLCTLVVPLWCFINILWAFTYQEKKKVWLIWNPIFVLESGFYLGVLFSLGFYSYPLG